MKKSISILLVLVLCLSVLPLGAAAATGWVKEDGEWYYYNADGTAYNGWLKDGGKWYYINYGWMVYGGVYYCGDYEDEESLYVFNMDGTLSSGGWSSRTYTYPSGLKDTIWFYANTDGTPYKGWLKENGKWYYFSSEGRMATGVWIIDGIGHVFRSNGVWAGKASGWTYDSVYDQWSYFNADGTDYTGWLKSGGKWYYISDGWMVYGGTFRVGETYYVFNTDGTLSGGGWVKEQYTSRYSGYTETYWYYANADGTGYNGWLKSGGKWYYIDHGWMAYGGIYDCNGTMYVFNMDGTLSSGGWVKAEYNYYGDYTEVYWYYANNDGTGYTGWVKSGGKWYYTQDGWMYRDDTYTIDGAEHKFDSNGVWLGQV